MCKMNQAWRGQQQLTHDWRRLTAYETTRSRPSTDGEAVVATTGETGVTGVAPTPIAVSIPLPFFCMSMARAR